ncbi:MAG: SUMF1/EgtB/PvdO family nonheme iron enzyme, partial [Candidatus Eremiobacteraeota bacterium]|nr:SUMF1/EgtB/PvdO family nonheme iron enzyme [Candidatus Eremiobacteraeota bacterium]
MTMLAPPALGRQDFLQWYRRNRERSRFLFDRVRPQAYESRPIPLRHPPVFYEGHLPAFSFNKLAFETFGQPALDARLQSLFERGIDPGNVEDAARAQRASWPSREQVWEFGAACDAAVEDAILHQPLDVPGDPRKERAHSFWTILEHEPMHHETFSYILHRMPLRDKVRPHDYRTPRDAEHPPLRRVEIPAGTATVGARRESLVFGWDNEFEAVEVPVPRFECDVYPVTNRQWMAFVRDGGPLPAFWIESDGGFKLLGAWEILPMLEAAPVWVTNEQARAYAAWSGRRLMTEAEYQRAGYATPHGDERPYPWGDEAPAPEHGNFAFQSWDVVPVGSHPAGDSAFGVAELIGNGWEHTATPFGPLPGFEPHASYPVYSADFFDGKHFVVKGASPVTAVAHIRRSFRNWYYGNYPYVFAKFRTVS